MWFLAALAAPEVRPQAKGPVGDPLISDHLLRDTPTIWVPLALAPSRPNTLAYQSAARALCSSIAGASDTSGQSLAQALIP